MDIRKVKKLIELLEESNIDEIEIKEGEESVRISRNGAKAMAMAAQAAPAPMRRQLMQRQRQLRRHLLARGRTTRTRCHKRGPHADVTHGRHLLPLTLADLSGFY